MDWIIWLLLCSGPPVIAYLKDRSPLTFFLIAVGLSGGLYFVGWGFMSITGATMGMVRYAGIGLGLLGVVASYALAFLATPAETKKKRGLRRKSHEMQCPNCAGFVLKVDPTCRYCGADLT